MIPSFEFKKLTLLARKQAPERVEVGDLYVITKDHRYVMLVMGHKKNGRRIADGHTFVWLYHWDQPSLRSKPADMRDFDGNATCAEAWLKWATARGENVKYAGNIFEYAPLKLIEGAL